MLSSAFFNIMESVIKNKPVPYSTAFGKIDAGSDYLYLRFLLTNKQPVKVDNCGSNVIKLCDAAELETITSANIEWTVCRNVITADTLFTDPHITISLVLNQETSEVDAIDVRVERDWVDATNDFVLWGTIEGLREMIGRGRVYTVKTNRVDLPQINPPT